MEENVSASYLIGQNQCKSTIFNEANGILIDFQNFVVLLAKLNVATRDMLDLWSIWFSQMDKIEIILKGKRVKFQQEKNDDWKI